jgi:hypothetical protein
MVKQRAQWPWNAGLERRIRILRILEKQPCSRLWSINSYRWRCVHRRMEKRQSQWKWYKFYYLGKYISSYGAEYIGDWKDDKQ